MSNISWHHARDCLLGVPAKLLACVVKMSARQFFRFPNNYPVFEAMLLCPPVSMPQRFADLFLNA